MQIELPEDYITLTRDIQDNDPYLSILGREKDEVLDYMEEQDIYLYSLNREEGCEIAVTMAESSAEKDFDQFSDGELAELTAAMPEIYENLGVKHIRSELYQHRQALFVRRYASHPHEARILYDVIYA